MESIRELYRTGNGPSSSHTMAPRKAAEIFLADCPSAHRYTAVLYGSLAATGKGHLTDKAIENVFSGRKLSIEWKPEIFLPRHPNGMTFTAWDPENNELCSRTFYSIGGGALAEGNKSRETRQVYDRTTMDSILAWCSAEGKQLWEYVDFCEESSIWDYIREIWKTMRESIERGLETEGTLPGSLHLARKAPSFYFKAKNYSGRMERRSMIFAYALAVSEENAAGGRIVTAPTCGSSGVLPAVLAFLQDYYKVSDKRILKAIATAGLIGNIVKHNASISGAEVGCQGEVGTACAMASAAAAQLFGCSIYQIEYAAEMGLEHHLGLTCDPICGYVQIPCIERNAFGAARALNHNAFVCMSDGRHTVSFDEIVRVMKQTGHDLPSIYKETSAGGMAALRKAREE